MGGHAGVFAGENAALVGHVLAEQIGVLVVQGVGREIDFGLGPGRAVLHRALAALVFVFMGFAGHNNLFDFAVKGVAAQRGIILLQFPLVGFSFLLRVPL